jgi:hypothetical protein
MKNRFFIKSAAILLAIVSLLGCQTSLGKTIYNEAITLSTSIDIKGDLSDPQTPDDETDAAVTDMAVVSELSDLPDDIVLTETVAAPVGKRDYRVGTKTAADTAVTVMIYLCGSDLETYIGAATDDLYEIMAAGMDNENVNIIVETGGANEWNNDFVNADTNQRFRIFDGEPILLEDVGKHDMTESETLSDFITWTAKNYPADRNFLFMWDHGGGTIGGLMYDERYHRNDSMPLIDFADALEKSNVIFDMIGIDCCFMGTAEMAFICEKYADFMIASQRAVPGTGFYYTDFMDAINKNVNVPTETIGEIIIEDFFEETPRSYKRDGEMTLSFIDLSYIPALFDELDRFFASADSKLFDKKIFIDVSQTLAGTKAINEYSQADLFEIADSLGITEELESCFENLVIENDSLSRGYNGLSLFFPYDDLSVVSDALEIYDEIGMSETFVTFMTLAANIMANGQNMKNNYYTNLYNDRDGDSFDYSWYDPNFAESYSEYFDDTSDNLDNLSLVKTGARYTLYLSDEQKELVTDSLLCVLYNDGDGYIDLGKNNDVNYDADGNLIIDFDYSWLSLGGQRVCYYGLESVTNDDGTYYNYGYVPCRIDGEEAEIILLWDNESPNGFTAGWRFPSDGDASMKGLLEFEDGMKIQFYCNYYSYDMEFEDMYPFSNPITVDGELIVGNKPFNESSSAGKFTIYYELHDIYQNIYETNSLTY